MGPLQLALTVPAGMLAYVVVAVSFLHTSGASAATDWRSASREPVGLAPDPATTPEAVVQVYAARALNWRGYFGVHPWVAVKRAGAPRFTVYEVNGWRLRRTGSSVVESERAPDARWFGNAPELLAEARGAGTEQVIDRIEAAVDSYPGKASTASGPARTRTPSSRTCCAPRRNCASTCRRLRWARITSGSSRSRCCRAAPARRSACSACWALRQGSRRASS